MTRQYAPGPYSVVLKPKQQGSTNHAILVQDFNGRNIATVYGKMDGEKEATAKLFALAPDMAKLLRYLHDTGQIPRLLEDHEAILRAINA